jgi:hypothetical protein
MNFKLYVDPSELKSDSKFIKCRGIKDLDFVPLPGLEERTGADILISPSNLPNPINEFLLKMHLDQGALLVQLKFGFDLVASIIDGRYKSSQAKMLATGAPCNQIVLLFIGLLFEPRVEKSDLILVLNGQAVTNILPQAKNFRFEHYIKHRMKWTQRGGIFENIIYPENVAGWIKSAAEVAFDEPASKQVWKPRQELFFVDGWINLIVNMRGCNIGEKKAQAIYDWIEDKSFYGFLAALEDGSLTNVPGIGPGTIEKIQKYLKGE